MRPYLLAILMMCASTVGFAKEQCAVESGETYVSRPESEKAPKKGPLRIHEGKRYEVGEAQDGWSLVNVYGSDVWARASLFGNRCKSTSAATGAHVPAPKTRSAETSRSLSSSPSTSGCPCGSGKVCVGPRGGRYCITSGGNKRYGV